MLEVTHLNAFYGKSQVLQGVDLRVGPGELVALLGRNGSGRSTTAKAIMGLVESEGSVRWRGHELRAKPTFEIAHHGLGYVAERRDVFPTLTVHQNLQLGQRGGRRNSSSIGHNLRWSFAESYAMFPALQPRQHTLAGLLSGGEQQMLSLARALMGEPELLILDEPTEGLAPSLRHKVGEVLRALKCQGISILLMEQKLDIALSVADRCVVMGKGRVVFEDTPSALHADAAVCQEWLAV